MIQTQAKQGVAVSTKIVPFPRAAPPEPVGRLAAGFDPMRAIGEVGLQDLVSPLGLHAALARTMVRPDAPLVWVQDATSRTDFGHVHARGLSRLGLSPARLMLVRTSRPLDALWAMEEALTTGLAVVGEIGGAPNALDFTATRRLEARARQAEVTCLLVRTGSRAQMEGSSAAKRRWRIMPQLGLPDPCDPKAPGRPRWLLELLRARERPPGRWVVETYDDEPDGEGRATHRLRVVSALADGGVAAREGARRSRTNVVRPRFADAGSGR